MSAPVLGSTPLANVFDPPGRPASARRGTILLVDDDVQVAKAYERILRRAGYVVDVMHDAQSALESFRRQKFDVIVSDISMPGMSGLDLLRSVREHDLDVPVVIMTGNPDVQSAMQALEYGGFRYVTKPVNLGTLLNIVARAQRIHQLARLRRDTLEELGTQGHHLGDRAGLEVRFGRAIQKLWMAYQPIVSWSGKSVHAYEALVRTDEPSLSNPCDLFDAAERLNRVHELGQAIRARVAETLARRSSTVDFFVNVHPEDLGDPTLVSRDSPLAPFADQVVLEITERAALDRIEDLVPRMAQLRAMGFRIAIDDLGAGYAGLNSFAQLEPEIVKVDMSIIRGIETSKTKQKLLASLACLCRDLEMQMVTEGIETAGERDTAVTLGADLCQGYLFGRPGRPFPDAQF